MSLASLLRTAVSGVQAAQARRDWVGVRVLRATREWTVVEDDREADRIVARDIADRRHTWKRSVFLSRKLVVL